MAWSEIPEDILVSIAKRLHNVTDYLCATEVCKTWRSIKLSPYYHLPIPRPPFLLLAEPSMKTEAAEQQEEDPEWEEEHYVPDWVSEDEYEYEEEEEKDIDDEDIPGRGIVGLNSREGDMICELNLPELHRNRCVGSTGNFLIIINKELQFRIFNPFTRTIFHLPSLSTLVDQAPVEGLTTAQNLRDRYLSKVVLSSTPNLANSDLGGVVAATIYGSGSRIAFAKPGDLSWITVEPTVQCDVFVDDAIFFRDGLYFVDNSGRLGFYQGFNSPTNTITAKELTDSFSSPVIGAKKYYLVECLGELLLVCKIILERPRPPYYRTKEFQVFKFDFDNAEWEEVRSLGQHSLFLGFNTSVSLLASPHSSSPFQRNCIYFTDDHKVGYVGNGIEGGRDMGIYNLEEARIFKPRYGGISMSLHSPPLWIIPRFLSQA